MFIKTKQPRFLKQERQREQGSCWMQPQPTPIHPTPPQSSSAPQQPALLPQLRDNRDRTQPLAPISAGLGADTAVNPSFPSPGSSPSARSCLRNQPGLGMQRAPSAGSRQGLGKQKPRAEGTGWVPPLTPLQVPVSHGASASSPPLSLGTKTTGGFLKLTYLRMAQYSKLRLLFGTTGRDSGLVWHRSIKVLSPCRTQNTECEGGNDT